MFGSVSSSTVAFLYKAIIASVLKSICRRLLDRSNGQKESLYKSLVRIPAEAFVVRDTLLEIPLSYGHTLFSLVVARVNVYNYTNYTNSV